MLQFACYALIARYSDKTVLIAISSSHFSYCLRYNQKATLVSRALGSASLSLPNFQLILIAKPFVPMHGNPHIGSLVQGAQDRKSHVTTALLSTHSMQNVVQL